MTEPLTTADKKILHACPTCSHLLASHDSAGCVPCSANDEDDQCTTTPRVIETTYEAVARVKAEVLARVEEFAADPSIMADAWGNDAAWFTTGTKVADLVSCWLREALRGES